MATIAAVDHGALNERVKPPPPGAASELAESLVTVAAVRLLVVEDEMDLAEAVARGLRREGYAVDIAFDGEEALEKLSYTEYDLVCLDLTLPKIDGREVCRRIRDGSTASTGARVLMLTARDAIEDRVAGLDEGADDYLVKPYAFAELTGACTHAAATRRRQVGRRPRGRRPAARHRPPHGVARRSRARAHGQGVRAAALLHVARRRGALAPRTSSNTCGTSSPIRSRTPSA